MKLIPLSVYTWPHQRRSFFLFHWNAILTSIHRFFQIDSFYSKSSNVSSLFDRFSSFSAAKSFVFRFTFPINRLSKELSSVKGTCLLSNLVLILSSFVFSFFTVLSFSISPLLPLRRLLFIFSLPDCLFRLASISFQKKSLRMYGSPAINKIPY